MVHLWLVKKGRGLLTFGCTRQKERNRLSTIFGSTIFGIIVLVFTVATVILAIEMAYIRGVIDGTDSQIPRINELIEELNPDLRVDFAWGFHPSWIPLLKIAIIFGVCWIAIAIIALWMRIRELVVTE